MVGLVAFFLVGYAISGWNAFRLRSPAGILAAHFGQKEFRFPRKVSDEAGGLGRGRGEAGSDCPRVHDPPGMEAGVTSPGGDLIL